MQLKKEGFKQIAVISLTIIAILCAVMIFSTKDTYAATKKLATPKISTVKNIDSEMVEIKWSKVKNVRNYYVYRSSTSNGKYTYIGASSTTKYQDKNVKFNKTYYYKIKAVNSGKYKASNLSKARSIKFIFDGKITAPNEITIYTDCFTYIPVGKGNSKEHIVLRNDIKGLYTMESVIQTKPGNNISNLVLEYDGPISEDIVFNAKICYYKYQWIDKTVLVRIKDSSKVPGYKANTNIPDYGIYSGVKASSTEDNGETITYKISNTQYFDYLKLLEKRGFKKFKDESITQGRCIYYIAPNGSSVMILIKDIDFNNVEMVVLL